MQYLFSVGLIVLINIGLFNRSVRMFFLGKIYNKYWWSNRKISYAALLCEAFITLIIGLSFAWLIAPPIVREEIEQELVWLIISPMALGGYFILAHALTVKHVRKRFRYTVDKYGKKHRRTR